MRPLTRWYVVFIVALATLVGFSLYRASPNVPSSAALDVLLLCVLALAAEALSFLLPRSATGSMAFIPYFALVLIIPSWPSVASVVVLRAVLEINARREAIKGIFNVAAHALTQSVAVIVYVGLGGTSLTRLPELSHLTRVTQLAGGPALLAVAAALMTNSLLVTGAVSISSGRSLIRTWLENNRATIGVDLLATPLVFVFAWVYAAFGVIATATLWIPILGLRQLQRTNLELEKTNRELLELMVKSLEARDAYTSGHSRRVHHYSTIIAHAIGLVESEVDQVGRAALLHDVGKIHEKYASVLAKTEMLTPEEWRLIQEHPADGAALVSTMSHLRDIVPAIRHHHENWDGTGYPDGLAGELIPLFSRIIRFADTIDAMTTERPYRAPMTEAQVRAEIVRCRGTQFDPMIADKLLSSSLWTSLFVPQVSTSVLPERAHLIVVGERQTEQREPMRPARRA